MNDLARELEARPRVSYRLMLRKGEDAWTLPAMADAGAITAPSFKYDYGHVAFGGGVITGARVSSWLITLKGKAAGFRFVVPKLQVNIHSDTH